MNKEEIKFDHSRTFTREEMTEHKGDIYSYILETLLDLKAPLELIPKKSIADLNELQKFKITGKLRREELKDLSLKYSW